MNDEKYAFRIGLEARQMVTPGTETPENLSAFVAESLGLIPARGKGLVAIKIIELLTLIAGKREFTVKTVKGRPLNIKNGAVKVEDIHKYLIDSGADIGIAQLYNTYITGLMRTGLIVKKKYSMYGLRGSNLSEALTEVRRDIDKEFERVVDHARKLDTIIKK